MPPWFAAEEGAAVPAVADAMPLDPRRDDYGDARYCGCEVSLGCVDIEAELKARSLLHGCLLVLSAAKHNVTGHGHALCSRASSLPLPIAQNALQGGFDFVIAPLEKQKDVAQVLAGPQSDVPQPPVARSEFLLNTSQVLHDLICTLMYLCFLAATCGLDTIAVVPHRVYTSVHAARTV